MHTACYIARHAKTYSRHHPCHRGCRPRCRSARSSARSPPMTTRAPRSSSPRTRRRWCCARACGRRGSTDGRFWYRVTTEKGSEAFLVDPVEGDEGARATCRRARRRRQGAAGAVAAAAGARGQAQRERHPLPGRQSAAAFVRDCNLWVRDVGDEEGDAAHDRRREGLRLRDQQRRLDEERPADPALVARLEEDRDLPADGRKVGDMYLVNTRVGHPRAPGVEVPAARRRTHLHAPARRHRRRRGEGRPAEDGSGSAPLARCATTSSAAAATGPTCSGARTARSSRSSRPRAITGTSSCAIADAATGDVRDVLEEKVDDVLRVGQRRASTGACCSPRTK